MAKRLTFNDAIYAHLKTLERYIPVVSRVHGGSHPEIFEVNMVFSAINKKIKEAESKSKNREQHDLPDLSEEFAKLREITHYYRIPHDVCESYEAVYRILADLDNAYHAKANTA